MLQSDALAAGVLDDVTSLMDLGIMLGALCAAALAGGFRSALAHAVEVSRSCPGWWRGGSGCADRPAGRYSFLAEALGTPAHRGP